MATGTDGDDRLEAGNGGETLQGLGGSDKLFGGDGDDTLDGGAAADIMRGGNGNDIYMVDHQGDRSEEASAAGGLDTVFSSVSYSLGAWVEELLLTGTAAIDGTGNDLDNVIRGNAGANILDGRAGADRMKGGDGDDTYRVDDAGDVVDETSASGGNDSVYSSVGYALGANVENLYLSGTAAVNGTGNALDNVLRGNAAANILDGGAGADRMKGGDGDDTYVVDNVGDIVDETSTSGGNDLVRSAVSYVLGANVENLTLSGGGAIDGTGNALANVIVGNSAANVLNGGAGADELRGGGGDDTYVVDNGGDRAIENNASGGIDIVLSSVSFTLGDYLDNLTLTGNAAISGTGNALSNVLIGNGAGNVLDGAGGADEMRGGGGDDTYVVDHAGDRAVENNASGGVDLVISSLSFTLGDYLDNLTLTGSGAINGTGNGLANLLVGNGSANVLDGAGGADEMRGGGGNDTYVVDHAGDRAVENSASGGVDLVLSSVSFTLGDHLDNLTLTGNGAINGTGNALANILTGNAAANVLDGGAGADVMRGGGGGDTYVVDHSGDSIEEVDDGARDLVRSSVSYTLGSLLEDLTLTGTAAIDATGNALANVLTGNAAANRLDGGAGADTMAGGDGDDLYIVDQAGDQAIETSAAGGTDTVRSAVSFALGANLENLELIGNDPLQGVGNALANRITGNNGANHLDGGAGADRLEGGNGDDSYVVDHVGDLVVEASGGGTDSVASSVSFTLGDHVENLTLTGAGAINGTGNGLANTIVGNAGANRIEGAAGDDVLNGLDGDDVLNGGSGSDFLTGGAGADAFEFTAALAADNVDRITDFGAGDVIRLGGSAAQPFAALATGALAGFAFRVGPAALDADDRIIYDSSTGGLYYDADGSGAGAAVRFATLTGAPPLTAADFVVMGAPNTAPTITSASVVSVAENTAASTVIYQAAAQDTDGDTFSFALSGADAAHFTLDQSGAVRFVSPPDYEVRNSYTFTVEARDSSGAAGARTVTVNVTDVGENSGAPYIVAETGSLNDSAFMAQPLDRGQFTITSNPNLPDQSLPSAQINGTISPTGDKDFFSITLKAGELLILDVDGTNSLDSYLRVFGPNGVELTSNDDSVIFDPGSSAHSGVGHNLDSLIRYRAPSDGTYYFSIASYESSPGMPTSSGSYTINVSIGPPASGEAIHEENVQALLSGAAWSTTNLTYSFTSSGADYFGNEGRDEIAAGMSPLNAQQQGAVQTILGQFASLTNLAFTQLTANPGAAQLRYALSNEPETAHAYYPGNGDGGDSWYNTLRYNAPVVGNYQWMTFLHETGHAMGLKHGHEAPALSADRDSMEYSVMTYRSYVGDPLDDGGYRNESWGFAQTLMMYDIAALQRTYGADFTSNAGDTIYSWSPNSGAFMVNGASQWIPGANRVFMTLWDGGGNDTYYLADYSVAMTIDLRPGEWSTFSAVQLANLGEGHMARGNVANALLYNGDPRSLIENAVGGSGNDVLIANQAANRLTGGNGADTFRWASAGDVGTGAFADSIADFASGDRIDLAGIDANSLTSGDDAFSFIGTQAFTGAPGQLRYQVVDGDAHVFADLNGDAVADLQIVVDNVTFLGGGEFNF